VIKAVPIVVKAAKIAARRRRWSRPGISRMSGYVNPPSHVIEEFLTHPEGL